jgi:hypothetical protein
MRLTPSELISWKCIFTSLSANIHQRKNLIFNSQDAGHTVCYFSAEFISNLPGQVTDGHEGREEDPVPPLPAGAPAGAPP